MNFMEKVSDLFMLSLALISFGGFIYILTISFGGVI